MDHYLDIDLRPDPEFAPHQLMSALFARLHRALVADPSLELAVSFPRHRADLRAPHLGDRLRLHGSQAALNRLTAGDWLAGLRDHVAVAAAPAVVPPGARHRAVRRVQAKSSPERLRRRLMKRHGLDAEEARRRIPDEAAETLGLPFLHLRSASTGQVFRLFVEHGPIGAEPRPGRFNAYGLSQTATVPWF